MDTKPIIEAGKQAAQAFESHDEKMNHVIEGINQMRAYIAGILDDAHFAFIRMRVDADLQRTQNFLNAIGGSKNVTGIDNLAGTDHRDFGPVTSILGKEIDVRKPITLADTSVSINEKAEFLRKRQDFLERLDTATDDQILDRLSAPGEETILRAAAKKLGLEDFREGPINVEFLQRMRDAKSTQDSTQSQVDEAELAANRLKDSDQDDEDAEEFLNEEDEEEQPTGTDQQAPPANKPKGKKK